MVSQQSSAPGAVLLSPAPLIPASRSDACQASPEPPEPSPGSAILEGGAGGSINRRTVIMNMLVSTAIAGALVPNQAAAAAPVERPDRRALEAYAAWLHFERRMLCQELWPEMGSASRWVVFAENAGFH